MAPFDPDNPITLFARTNFRNERRPFGIRRRDRRSHMHILGRTGMGKSTLLETLMAADLRAGNGFALLDPHGDLAAKILIRAREHRAGDLIEFDPSDRPVAYSPRRVPNPAAPYVARAGFASAFRTC